ncbi:substrate-binding domain-containing protein [Caldinitratiruptor microaerophilus]|uniref:Tungsten ABC transporter substrate-binding protein n=1 Tax=Caldinitratiruptor microaerophilus TaxID=671077 RepID=A0AA35CN59_9FIRM|nr:substrate-binding domain-containing protein [Caldinitratiruptor microaerophilus]BDG62267.1 tungsten ABC transporter substrate-binding protein [Caldinitratiruptor microaerophilus]
MEGRRVRAAVLVAFLAGVLAATACGRRPATTEAGAGQERGETTAQEAPKPATPDVILATTTSTQDSGLLDVLVPMFEQKTGYRVKTIAVGTGQALAMAERGEADVVLVHAPDAEKAVVEKGAVVDRRLVMHNDFVLVGPPDDPARVRGTGTAVEAFKRIAAAGALFVSRGDDSGTHKKEQSLWKAAGITPQGTWYQESGSGMGQTLNIASEKGGYTLTDRATYLALRKNLRLAIVLEGDAPLLNVYHVMRVNPQKFSKVNAEGGKAFVEFLVAPETQALIGKFGVDKFGQPLFFPDAGKREDELGAKS